MVLAIGLGWWAGKKTSSAMDDFFLYGRKAAFFVLYLAVVATYHSAFAFLGAPGYFYTHGLSFLDAACWTILVGLLIVLYGARIQILGKSFNCFTPADMFELFFNSPHVRLVVAIIGIVFSVFYIQVQSMGLGYILSTASGGHLSYPISVALLLGVAALYVISGGIRAVYWTDVLQGIWMYLAVWAGAAFIIFSQFGSLSNFWHAILIVAPAHLTLPGPKGFFTYQMWFSYLIIFSVGVFLQPHLFVRFYTARSAKMVRKLGATTPLYLTSLYFPICLVGLAGVVLMPGLDHADRIFPALLFRYAPVWLTGIVLAGAAAASMSTMDAILHANSLIFTRDLYQRFMAPEKGSTHYISVGRLVVFALLVLSFFLSVYKPDFLVRLVALSSSGALLLWPGVHEILYPGTLKIGPQSLLWGIGSGVVVLIVTIASGVSPLGLHGGIWALAVDATVAIVASKFLKDGSLTSVDKFLRALKEQTANEK